MGAPLLTTRERVIWLAGFLLITAWLAASHFTSSDGDSGLHAGISSKLADTPASRWLAPEWWGLWPEAGLTGLYLEHPVGVFLLPAVLQRLGLPAEQGAYVVGIAAGIISLLLLATLVERVTSRAHARAALVLLQIMPVAFIFRIRANHEYLMLVCLFAALLGMEGVKRAWWWVVVVAMSLATGLVVKGVFVSLIALAAGLWILIDPLRSGGARTRQWLALAVGLGCMALVALTYDAIYLRATGGTFWAAYWARQMAPVTFASPITSARLIVEHLGFYVVRLLWHPAPWSLVLLWVGGWWRPANEGPATDRERHALRFILIFSGLAAVVLSLPSRFAERYVFSVTYLIAAAGIVATARVWPAASRALARLDASVPALPALTWIALMALRLLLGPWLPRIG